VGWTGNDGCGTTENRVIKRETESKRDEERPYCCPDKLAVCFRAVLSIHTAPHVVPNVTTIEKKKGAVDVQPAPKERGDIEPK
jgi:hypothetical protein